MFETERGKESMSVRKTKIEMTWPQEMCEYCYQKLWDLPHCNGTLKLWVLPHMRPKKERKEKKKKGCNK